jgi:hypothetical protein
MDFACIRVSNEYGARIGVQEINELLRSIYREEGVYIFYSAKTLGRLRVFVAKLKFEYIVSAFLD